jgi:hypothetical protein
MNIEAALDLLKYNDTVFASLDNDIKVEVLNYILNELPKVKDIEEFIIGVFSIEWYRPFINIPWDISKPDGHYTSVVDYSYYSDNKEVTYVLFIGGMQILNIEPHSTWLREQLCNDFDIRINIDLGNYDKLVEIIKQKYITIYNVMV